MQKLSTSGQINLTAAITLLQASFSFYSILNVEERWA